MGGGRVFSLRQDAARVLLVLPAMDQDIRKIAAACLLCSLVLSLLIASRFRQPERGHRRAKVEASPTIAPAGRRGHSGGAGAVPAVAVLRMSEGADAVPGSFASSQWNAGEAGDVTSDDDDD